MHIASIELPDPPGRTLPVWLHRCLRLAIRPRLRGVWRLAARVMDCQRVRFPERPVRATTRLGFSMWVLPNDPVGRAIFYRGEWEPPVIRHFVDQLRPGDYVLDVGANVGQFALAAASRIGPAGRVVAVEPGRRACELLERSVGDNGFQNVAVHRCAAWDTAGTLYLSGESDDITSWIRTSVDSQAAAERVPCVRLDDLLDECCLPRIDVMKIDIEGGEVPALNGMSQTFERQPPRAVYCEVATNFERRGGSAHELLEFFDRFGYQPWELADAGPQPLDRKQLDEPINVTVAFLRA